MQRLRIHLRLLLVVGLAAICTGSAVGPQIRAEGIRLEQLQSQIFEVVDQASQAIVEVRRRGSIFSGVIVSPDGHILTAGHTIVPGQRCTVILPDGRRFAGEALGASEQMRGERLDCGLIRVETTERLPFVPLGSSANISPKQPCLSISYPGGQRLGGQPVVRFGWIERPSQSGRMIQSTALMEPGDSGGPLLDLDGHLIGIHSRIGTRMDQNYDVPVDAFKRHWDALNVAQTFTAQNGRTVPRLGFVGRDAPQGEGITVLSVIEGSIAEEMGLQPNDVLTKFQDQSLSGLRDLHNNLAVAIENQTHQNRLDQLSLAVKRGKDQLEYLLPADRLFIPRADRIEGLDESPLSRSNWSYPDFDWKQYLSDYGKDFRSAVAAVSSQFDDQRIVSSATPIKFTHFLVGKSSTVGIQPRLLNNERPLDLTIIARNSEHDLVLLRSPEVNHTGVQYSSISQLSADGTPSRTPPRQGQFLWSPQPDGSMIASVFSGDTFSSPRVESRGFLGVVLRDHDSQGVVLLEVDEGAAERAGLKVGDVILRMGDTKIGGRADMLRFLGSSDPATTVSATVRRASTEFEALITLGTFPQESSHAADMMQKSLRRDGFPKVFCHDADLQPSGCGGPVFDDQGNWVAVNIARYSRVRTFALPVEVVIAFVEPHIGQ